MITIEEALSFAMMAHKGQKDLDGKPVILHPIRVGLSGENENEMIVGFLHDVVEDTKYTFDDLRKAGVNDEVLEALMLLTRTKDISYPEYVDNLLSSGNKLALAVKRHDVMDNLARNNQSTERKKKIYEKHTNALQKLNNI